MSYGACEVTESGRVVSRTHNGRTFEVLNPRFREIGVVEVDGCVINDQSKRVDWIVRLPIRKRLKDGTDCLKLIELKGSNVPQAFAQMRATIAHTALAGERELIDEGLIVSQLTPLFQSVAQTEAAKFLEDFGVPVNVVKRAVIDATP